VCRSACSFDVAIICFPDQQRALAGMKRALWPGGRLAAHGLGRETAHRQVVGGMHRHQLPLKVRGRL